MRIYLAGGSGVLGQAIIPLLVGAGHDVTATTRSTARTPLLSQLGATPVVVNALDLDAVARSMQAARPDAVMHLLTDLSAGDLASNARLRTIGTRNLVDAAQRIGVTRMVAESISWVYQPGTSLASENDPLDLDAGEPRRTTIAGVRALENAVRELPAGVVLRFGQLYGPGTWYSRDGRFGQDARAGRLLATASVTSFLHIADAASAAILALGWPAGIWNIVDDEPAAGSEWVPSFAAAVGAPDVPRPDSTSGDIGRPVSNGRAHELGFALQHPSWRTGFGTL